MARALRLVLLRDMIQLHYDALHVTCVGQNLLKISVLQDDPP